MLAVLAITVASVLGGCELMVAPSPSPRPTPRVTIAPPTDEPSPTEIEEVPTLRPDPSGAIADLVDAANALADLDSYRVAVSTRGLVDAVPANGSVAMESTLVQGDEPAARFSMTGAAAFAEGRLQAVVIGDRAWLKEGFGAWRRSAGGAADFDAAFTTLSPIDLVSEFESLSDAIQLVGPEMRNGRRTLHYRADAGDAAAEDAGLSKGSIDVWFAATGGALVGLAIDGTWDLGGTPTRVVLRIDVTRVNDPSNRVTAPI